MKAVESDLDVTRSGRNIVLANKDVRLVITYRDGGYSQEFYGIDRTGHAKLVLSTIYRDLIPFTEHRTLADPMFSAHRDRLFELSRESIRMAFTDARVTQSAESVSVKLSGGGAECRFTATLTLRPDSKFVEVRMEAEFLPSRRPHLFEYLMSAYAFLPDGMLLDSYGRPDYAWSPSLRPEDDHIVSERSFSTAAVLVQHGKLAAAIIPSRERTDNLPLALDLDLRNGLLAAPLISCGLCDSVPDGHFSRHDRGMVFRPDPGVVSYGFTLYIDADARLKSACEPVQEFIWSQARARAESSTCPSPQIGLSDTASAAYKLKSFPTKRSDSLHVEQIIDRILSLQREDGLFVIDGGNETGAFDTVKMSELCRWLLAIHRDFGGDLRILSCCRAYADTLLASQAATGAIPSLLSTDLQPLPELRDCAQTAASGRFLAELYSAVGDRPYLAAAARAMRFASGLVARTRYLDRATLLSGVSDVKDLHTCLLPQGAAAMRNIADLAIAMYRIAGDPKHLKTGLAALAQMCWLQDTWSDRPGAFFPSNACDGGASHAAFGRTMLEYYEVTDKMEHLERAAAAIRAGIELGDPDAPAIQRWAMKRCGAALIYVREHAAYALGPCSVDRLEIRPGRISFEMRNGKSGELPVRFHGLRAKSYELCINGEVKHYPKGELESGIRVKVMSNG